MLALRLVGCFVAWTLIGCGGLASGVADPDGGTSRVPVDRWPHDSCAIKGVPLGPGGCLNTQPMEGTCCDPAQSICAPSDPCCGDGWTCAAVCDIDGCTGLHLWQKSGLGCACAPEDAGADAGRDAAADGSDAGTAPCGDKDCGLGEVCVTTNSGGGPCLLPIDGGLCPKGTMLEGGCCVSMSTSLSCKTLPTACDDVASCSSSSCASALCGPGCMCASASGGEVTCDCLAP